MSLSVSLGHCCDLIEFNWIIMMMMMMMKRNPMHNGWVHRNERKKMFSYMPSGQFINSKYWCQYVCIFLYSIATRIHNTHLYDAFPLGRRNKMVATSSFFSSFLCILFTFIVSTHLECISFIEWALFEIQWIVNFRRFDSNPLLLAWQIFNSFPPFSFISYSPVFVKHYS